MSAHRRASERGFTLIELLVASIAGLFVVLAAFMLSRGATRLFASEGRVANSQLNLRLGVDRLRQDLERAGFMTTPNASIDPDVCPRPTPASFSVPLQSVLLQMGDASTSSATTKSAENGLYPDTIQLTGNFATTDVYLVASIQPSASGSGIDIALQKDRGATVRLLTMGETGSPLSALTSAFGVDRIIRLRNGVGVSQYLIIASAVIAADGKPVITTKAAPGYVLANDASAVDKRCGGSGFCVGCEVNPVQVVQYRVGSLAADTRFTWAYPTGDIGDTYKYDLIRSEIAANGATVTNSEEIVAEYVADLAFSLGVDSSPPATAGSAYADPIITQIDFGLSDNKLYADSILTTATRPQRIRSIRYRLTTRTRFSDSSNALDDGGAGLFRYKLDANRFARARTMVGDVALLNQTGIRW